MPMQPMRKIILLIIALLIGAGTIVLSRGMIAESQEKKQAVAEQPKIHEILVAARDLPAGTLLKETDLRWQVWPEAASNEGHAVKGVNNIEEYYGTVVRYGMAKDEPLVAGRTVKPGEQGFMAAALSPGMRAVSIAITPVAGVAGFVFPGDHVDVIVTHQIGRKTDIDPMGRRVSETMLRNVRVLALDQQMSNKVVEPKVAQIATLEVTPKQAETIALITELGTVSLALRSIANDPSEEGATTTVSGASTAAPTLTWDSDVSRVLPRPANRTGAVQKVTIIRGTDVTESIYDLQQQQ